jgi:pyruvate dehydrogenase E1 component
MQSRRGLAEAPTWILDQVFSADRAVPMVTVLDGHPHALTFLTGINDVNGAALGVTRFARQLTTRRRRN